ncbi:MAG: RNase adapter RapZ [Alphaproteobacteria bacterium]|nr:RNase adapter RapZ [Alphaproteobacteria bacterium]
MTRKKSTSAKPAVKKKKKIVKKTAARPVLLVTGLSGAGLSSALKGLEDIGYKAVDNLPISLVEPLLAMKQGQGAAVAIGIDSRTWDFTAAGLQKLAAALRAKREMRVSLLFINCQDSVLQQRYTETRRLHPQAVDRPVADGVALERQMMRPLLKEADQVIDTSDLKPHDLHRILEGYFSLDDKRGLCVLVTSFGFRNGLPREADLVFDVRFLDNPHWDAKLRPLSGRDAPVAAKIKADKGYKPFFRNLTQMLEPLLPLYARAGKRYLTIAVGCTGGRHRSVFTAEELNRWLQKKGVASQLRHRDLERWAQQQFHRIREDKKSSGKTTKKRGKAA